MTGRADTGRTGLDLSRRVLSRRGFLTALGAAGAGGLALAACGDDTPPAPGAPPPSSGAPSPAAQDGNAARPAGPVNLQAPPAEVASRATVPVLCWHQLRDWRPDDSPYARNLLICPPAAFASQMAGIADAGYTPIGPDDYLSHLTTGAPLPPKPILLTFDDSQGSQMQVALPELARRRMTATFFVMTVPLDKPNWMSKADVRRLHDAGMTIAGHTYDHHRVDRYTDADWRLQLEAPKAELEGIIGAPVRHFAYPYGAWSAAAFPHLAAAGYQTAFQLQEKPADPANPLFTLRRVLVDSHWDGAALQHRLTQPL